VDVPATDTGVHNTLADGKVSDLSAIFVNFIRSSPDYAIVTTGKDVVLYDAHALIVDVADVKTVTFDMVDGSSLSLVGLPAALPHEHVA
jgi:hypothetical protein